MAQAESRNGHSPDSPMPSNGWLRCIGPCGLTIALLLWTLSCMRPHANGLLTVNRPRVVVLKNARTLHLFDGLRLVRSYPIDLGKSPQGDKLRRGDCRTPEGRFRVSSKNPDSSFHRFIGINYPTLADIESGLQQGLISMGDAASLRRAVRDGTAPDGNSPLGGGIGIHGQRRGVDWTGGCIALSNDHAAELYAVLRPGDEVEILP